MGMLIIFVSVGTGLESPAVFAKIWVFIEDLRHPKSQTLEGGFGDACGGVVITGTDGLRLVWAGRCASTTAIVMSNL